MAVGVRIVPLISRVAPPGATSHVPADNGANTSHVTSLEVGGASTPPSLPPRQPLASATTTTITRRMPRRTLSQAMRGLRENLLARVDHSHRHSHRWGRG